MLDAPLTINKHAFLNIHVTKCIEVYFEVVNPPPPHCLEMHKTLNLVGLKA